MDIQFFYRSDIFAYFTCNIGEIHDLSRSRCNPTIKRRKASRS